MLVRRVAITLPSGDSCGSSREPGEPVLQVIAGSCGACCAGSQKAMTLSIYSLWVGSSTRCTRPLPLADGLDPEAGPRFIMRAQILIMVEVTIAHQQAIAFRRAGLKVQCRTAGLSSRGRQIQSPLRSPIRRPSESCTSGR